MSERDTGRILKQGASWRIGWNPQADIYCGLVGGADWAFELTAEELQDFCRLLAQLRGAIADAAAELMDEERISCEAESDRLWMEVEGYPGAYSLRVQLYGGRRSEGYWEPEAARELAAAASTLGVF